MELNRRQFVMGASVAGISALAAGMVGCSSPSSKEKASGSTAPEREISETIDADIVVVGGGMSGLAAAVQAGCNKDKAVLIEIGECGGAGNGVEGIFGVNSPLQKEQGITLNKAEVLTDEVAATNYTVDGLMWKEMIDASGDNIAWLLEQGAELSGVVDGYLPGGRFHTFHWWKNGHAKDGYVQQMVDRASELGVDIRTHTAAESLIMEEGKVAGLYAKKSDDTYVQINTRAVILAAGGFIGNKELLAKQMNIVDGEMAEACLQVAETLHRMGSGMNMALEAGARNYPGTCIEGWYQPEGMPVGDASQTFSLMITDDVSFRQVFLLTGFGWGTTNIWVEENAQRFVDEGSSYTEIERTFTTRKFYKNHYQIFDRANIETTMADPSMLNAFETMVKDYPESIYQDDTIEGLAKKLNLDPVKLQETVEKYNSYCESGVDEDFGKSAEYLAPLTKPPFYGFRCEISGDATLGGICVDRNFRAVNDQKEPIDGLYMAGVDACMLYNCVYPIGVPGTACCNSINSGRKSANHAHEYIQSV